jgi:hypothetical protein
MYCAFSAVIDRILGVDETARLLGQCLSAGSELSINAVEAKHDVPSVALAGMASIFDMFRLNVQIWMNFQESTFSISHACS